MAGHDRKDSAAAAVTGQFRKEGGEGGVVLRLDDINKVVKILKQLYGEYIFCGVPSSPGSWRGV